jgi:drug/metabolite transporter (DMT)-like permease
VSRIGIVRCALAAILFGISAPAASRLAGDMGPFTLAGLLYVGAAVAVAPWVGRAWPSARAVQRNGFRLGIAVIVGGAVGPLLLAAGLGRVPAATASLLLNLELVFTTIVAFAVFREHLGGRVVVGTGLVVLAGTVLGWSDRAELRWGAVLIAGACVCWAIDNGVTAALDDLAPSVITFAKGVVAGGANLAIGLLADGGPPAMSAVGAGLVVGAFGYGLSITLWVAGARDLGAARGQLVFATAPFVGAVVAWTAFAEPAAPRELASLVIAAFGVAFVLRSDHEHQHDHAPVDHDHEHRHDDGHHRHDHERASEGRHSHVHHHERTLHRHPHVPDLHHRHGHDDVAVGG